MLSLSTKLTTRYSNCKELCISCNSISQGYNELREKSGAWARLPGLIKKETGINVRFLFDRSEAWYFNNYLLFESEKDKLAFILKYS